MVHNGWLAAQAGIAGMERQAITPVIAGAMVSDLAQARMAVPARVRLGPDRLEWIPGTDDDATHLWREGEPASGALWAFIKLATEPDGERFVDFARRFGVLALTTAGRPSVSRQVPDAHGPQQLLDEPWCGFAVNWEPIAAWRAYAAIARAIVHLAMALRRGTPINARRTVADAGLDLETDPFAWEFQITTLEDERTKNDYIFNLHHRRLSTLVETLDRPGRDLASQRQWLAFWVTHGWIAESALLPTITWDSDRPQLCLPIGSRPPGIDQLGLPSSAISQYLWPPNMLFNILAAHLAAFICSGEPVARCNDCGELHSRARKPRADQPVYCDACRPEAERRRKREHASRRRARERAST